MNKKRARDKKPVTVAIMVRASMHQARTWECDFIFFPLIHDALVYSPKQNLFS